MLEVEVPLTSPEVKEILYKYSRLLESCVFLPGTPNERSLTAAEIDGYQVDLLEERTNMPYLDDRDILRVGYQHGFESIADFTVFMASQRVLDIGSGNSTVAQDLKSRFKSTAVITLDREDPGLCAVSVEQGKHVHASGVKLPFADASFDRVISTFCLPQWAETPQEGLEALQEMLRVVKKFGFVAISPFVDSLESKAFTVVSAASDQVPIWPGTIAELYKDMLVINQVRAWERSGTVQVGVGCIPVNQGQIGERMIRNLILRRLV